MTVKKAETHKFDAEIGKVLNLVINSLYTNKDIFLRELLSNASDACDKLRYELNSNDKLSKAIGNEELKITVTVDENNRTLEISDTGIGMDKDDLINNLGTIAKSGTQGFLENLSDDAKKDSELIGQFGVGFYSGYMVADEVTVISSKAGSDKTYVWKSAGKGEFSIAETSDKIRGTKIQLHIKTEMSQFLDKFNLKTIVKTYSDHIAFPIELTTSDEGEGVEVVNSSGALWTKAKSEVNKEEYNTFYKSIAHTAEDPWLTLHNKAEGVIEYTNLLFIPSQRPFDLFHPDRKCQVKLYVKKVFITEDNVELIPAYLRFLKGIVDSQDLPLNISRETLQNNAVIDKIRNSVVKKIFAELGKKLAKDRENYEKFWDNFGSVLKEALCEYTTDKEAVFDLCLFKTSKSKGKYITLKEYKDNMKKDQEAIYCLIGNDLESMNESPQIEAFNAKDVEVLFLTDGVDDFWLTSNPQYQEKEFKSVTKAADDAEKISETEEEKKKSEANETKYKALIDSLKETLKDKVADVRVSKKLTTSPACLAVSEGSMDIRMERMMMEQGQVKEASKKILEINANHKIIKNLDKKLKTDKKAVDEYAHIIFDQACIIEGEAVQDPMQLAKRIAKLLESNLAA